MSTYTSPVREWIEPLRNFALGVSMASLFLIPPAGSTPIPVRKQPVQQSIKLVTTIPDGTFDFRIVHIRTSQGLEPVLPLSPIQVNDKIESESIPQILRDLTGLPVETLASLAKVSRNAYNKWLDGKGISDEHLIRLRELLDTFRTLHDLRGTDLKEFLEAIGPSGRPIDLLAAGDSSAVIGLALRPISESAEASAVSHIAQQMSGLSGWLKPATKLNWGAPRLTDIESDEALDRLNPRPLSKENDQFNSIDTHDEVYVAWGFSLE